MKAVSLWQPWGSAMALGKKLNETRGYRIHHRGDLAICAAKRPMDFGDWRLVELFEVDISTWKPFYGCVLCVVEVFGCEPTGSIRHTLNPTELLLGDYSFGRLAWRTRKLRPLKNPVPVRGYQGLFDLPPAVEKAVRAQIEFPGQ